MKEFIEIHYTSVRSIRTNRVLVADIGCCLEHLTTQHKRSEVGSVGRKETN